MTVAMFFYEEDDYEFILVIVNDDQRKHLPLLSITFVTVFDWTGPLQIVFCST